MNYSVAAFYRFVDLQDLPRIKNELLREFTPLNLCGTLLLASEGINGTMAGAPPDVDNLMSILQRRFGMLRDEVKISAATARPFQRLKVRLKREIITFRQPGVDPVRQAGTYVAPSQWNALIDDPEVVVLDTRNKYETMMGAFDKARDPGIDSFTAFADYVRANLDPARDRKIAMYCTGGIRCEKASAFMRAEGFGEVYHLKGGILKYLEEIAPQNSKWRGDCYVFDQRVAVGHGLRSGDYSMCFNCGAPLAANDRQHAHYEEGVSCAGCFPYTSEKDKARYRMRQRQMADSAA